MNSYFIKIAFVVLGFLMVGTGKVIAQVKYSNEFLNIGVGARYLGLGSAGAAMSADATAGYWNPSGLADMEARADFSLMHAEYFAGIAKYDYGSAAYKIDENSAVGLSLIRFGVDDIPNTLELIDNDGNVRYDRIRTFSSSDLAVLFSYARKVDGLPLNYGGNFKLIYRHTGEFAKAWGFGLDASLTWKPGLWRIAAIARDVTSTFNAWSFNQEALREVFLLTGNEIPENSLEITVPRLILSAGRQFAVSDDIQLMPVMDFHLTFDGRRHVLLPLGGISIDPYAGAEISYAKWLYVRLGIGNFQRVKGLDGNEPVTAQPSLGIGVRFKNIYLDYALTDIGDLSIARYSNIISLSYRLDR